MVVCVQYRLCLPGLWQLPTKLGLRTISVVTAFDHEGNYGARSMGVPGVWGRPPGGPQFLVTSYQKYILDWKFVKYVIKNTLLLYTYISTFINLILHCTEFYCAVLYATHCTVRQCSVLHCTLFNVLMHWTVMWCGVVHCSMRYTAIWENLLYYTAL